MSENEIQVQEPAEIVAFTPVAAAMQILGANKDFDVDKLGAILELQMTHEANEARKEYASDFTIAQASMGSVAKNAWNKQTSSYYAKLEAVIDACKPVYTEHGFSVVFYEGETEKAEHVRVCADVMHKTGHEKTYHIDVPLDGVGIKGNANMTKIHGKASSVSYGERYLLCMIWNLPTEDNDGNGGPAKVAEFQEPVGNQKKAVEKTFDMLFDSVPEGKSLSWSKLCKEILNRFGAYPSGSEQAIEAAKAIVEQKLINLVCEGKK